uniref:Uncharacterized protein n=1 Tax=Zea mays TaxID=4577 RepID=C0P3J1_MAIZE|nr:unknown [Zea mays]
MKHPTWTLPSLSPYALVLASPITCSSPASAFPSPSTTTASTASLAALRSTAANRHAAVQQREVEATSGRKKAAARGNAAAAQTSAATAAAVVDEEPDAPARERRHARSCSSTARSLSWSTPRRAWQLAAASLGAAMAVLLCAVPVLDRRVCERTDGAAN